MGPVKNYIDDKVDHWIYTHLHLQQLAAAVNTDRVQLMELACGVKGKLRVEHNMQGGTVNFGHCHLVGLI